MIQQIHPHVRVERDSGMCSARDLVRVDFLENVCIVSDQTSEAGNVKCNLYYIPEVVSDLSCDFNKIL
jgi:hypothetical protein